MDLKLEILESTKLNLIYRIKSHSFVDRCRRGQVRLDELKLFLVQQGLYSAYFTRYLCALMSNLPSNSEVMELAENLFEELGLEDGNKSTPHHLIYREMLKRFGLTLENAEPTAGTAALIDAMLSHCKNEPLLRPGRVVPGCRGPGASAVLRHPVRVQGMRSG
jgi:thiaminase